MDKPTIISNVLLAFAGGFVGTTVIVWAVCALRKRLKGGH
jgi:hypothetical protein